MENVERLKVMRLSPLALRRLRGDVIEIYKHLHGIYRVDYTELLPLDRGEGVATRGHSLKLQKRLCRASLRANSFVMRVVNTWNSLPEDIVNAPSVNAFKNIFDKFCDMLSVLCCENLVIERRMFQDQPTGQRPTRLITTTATTTTTTNTLPYQIRRIACYWSSSSSTSESRVYYDLI